MKNTEDEKISIKLKDWLNVETVIVLLVALSLIFLNLFTNSVISRMQEATRNAIFISDEMDVESDERVVEELRTYLPTSYKMIEVYDINMELIMQLQFGSNDESNQAAPAGINSSSQLAAILKGKDEGQTVLKIEDVEEDIYYKWITNNNGERRLIVVYSTVMEVKGIWIISMLCYAILIMVFFLLIRLHIRNYSEKIAQYRSSTNGLTYQLHE